MPNFDPHFELTGEEAKGLLFGLLEVNKAQYGAHPEWPSVRQLILDGKIRYREHDPEEHWQSVRELIEAVERDGVAYADCEDLGPALAAEDQVRYGIDSQPYAYSPQPGLFHVVTAVPEGAAKAKFGANSRWPRPQLAPDVPGYVLQDPSAAAGMNATHVSGASSRYGASQFEHFFNAQMEHNMQPFSWQRSAQKFWEDAALDELEARFPADAYGGLFDGDERRSERRSEKAGDLAREVLEALGKGDEKKARSKAARLLKLKARALRGDPDWDPQGPADLVLRWYESGQPWATWSKSHDWARNRSQELAAPRQRPAPSTGIGLAQWSDVPSSSSASAPSQGGGRGGPNWRDRRDARDDRQGPNWRDRRDARDDRAGRNTSSASPSGPAAVRPKPPAPSGRNVSSKPGVAVRKPDSTPGVAVRKPGGSPLASARPKPPKPGSGPDLAIQRPGVRVKPGVNLPRPKAIGAVNARRVEAFGGVDAPLISRAATALDQELDALEAQLDAAVGSPSDWPITDLGEDVLASIEGFETDDLFKAVMAVPVMLDPALVDDYYHFFPEELDADAGL